MKIFCAILLNGIEKEYLRKGVGNAELFFQDEISDEPIHRFLECEVGFGNPPREWIEQSNNLKWLQLESVGYDPYLSLKNRKVKISNLKGFFSVPVAESAVAGILALMRGINELVLLKEKKEWVGSAMRPSLRMLEGSSVLILGAGAIGCQMKKLFLVFNCQVSFYDKFNPKAEYAQPEELNKALPEADVIIGCLPESPETVHLLNEERLDMLKPSAIVVNVGRGALIDEEVLVQKLMNRDIAGAVLDVTSIEPLPSGHLLWSCPNTILSQHTAGGFDKEIVGKIDIFLQNLKHYIKNESLINVIK